MEAPIRSRPKTHHFPMSVYLAFGKRTRLVNRKWSARRDVTDGLSKTYYAAEKMIPADEYEDGTFWGDSNSIFVCPLGDCVRFAEQPPQHDPLVHLDQNQACKSCHNFGGSHPSTWNAVYCDGSVHALTFIMSFATHRALASRAAGDATNPKED